MAEQPKSKFFTEEPRNDFTPEQLEWLKKQKGLTRITRDHQGYHLFLSPDGTVIRIPKIEGTEKPMNI